MLYNYGNVSSADMYEMIHLECCAGIVGKPWQIAFEVDLCIVRSNIKNRK